MVSQMAIKSFRKCFVMKSKLCFVVLCIFLVTCCLWKIYHYQSLPSTRSCTDQSCSNFLATSDSIAFQNCTKVASNKFRPIDQGKCVFMNGTGRQPIALTSFPGSGNTWVRGLLQQVTGFCTGSLSCDPDLRRHGFVGESITSGFVLVVKTHKPSFYATKSGNSSNIFQQAVYIIRNPFDAIIAERNLQLSNDNSSRHLNSAGSKDFGNNLGWNKLVTGKLDQWNESVIFWLEWGQNHPLLVVQYENLLNNTSREIHAMLQFLGVQISLEDITQKLEVPFSLYHRHKKGNFTHYTSQQTSQVNEFLRNTQKELMTTGVDIVTKYNLYIDNYARNYNT